MHFDPNIDYPIRKKNCFTNSIDEICYDLINTKLKFTEISKKYNKSTSTISRINNGETHFNPNFSYPLRKEPVTTRDDA